MSELIETLPVVALRGMTILPDMVIHFDVSRERSVKAIEEAMLRDQRVFLVTQKDVQVDNPGPEDLYRIGTIASVKQVIKMPQKIIRVLAEGLERGEWSHFSEEGDYLEAEIIRFEKDTELEALPETAREAMTRNLAEIFSLYCRENGKMGKDTERQILEEHELEKLMSQVIINLPLFYEDKQKLLEAVNLSDRYELLCLLMDKEIEIMRFKKDLQQKVKTHVDKNQREYLLREELKVIREELGEDNTLTDADHYGMEQVKERVLEYLAVRILTKKGSSPILCLVGPPGTGKTSIARSIARALNKKYVRISLGGVRDEAEIRGHRRTYVGAMPGRIATGMKQAGVKNPLMLLDEIDKVSSDYKGDTSSALLEVLDSEQNSRFQDHYVELPMDLSEVLFIATANDVQTIPRPLLDRMELIEVSSYTENEKVHIAREHLISKQMERNGLKDGQLTISPKALEALIHSYTREAGVRQLERKIGEVCRKAAREILEQKKKSVKLTENNLEKYLGKPRYHYDMANETDEIGIVRGLAWTSVGGDTLQIEVNIMPGKGDISLTGQLGDVMKESARTGLSYIRSVSDRYGIDKKFFREHDIHIHIPEGAVPKDGPSAGITMATAMLSVITGIPVYAHVAMTGEITLRGRVLPIGGLKEKLLAAKNAGIKTVIVPEKNRRDVEEISNEIKKGLEIVYAEQMEDVLKIAFQEASHGDKK